MGLTEDTGCVDRISSINTSTATAENHTIQLHSFFYNLTLDSTLKKTA